MAEERNLGLARAPEASADPDATKAELQRRMEEARESISQTVTEIKDTVVNQYQQVKENISDTLDWREQYKRHTVPFTVGAFAAGAVLGYTVMGALSGDGDDEGEYDDDGAFDRIESGFDRMEPAARSYAASPVIGAAHAPSAYQRTSAPESNAATESAEVFGREGGGRSASSHKDAGPDARPSYSSGYQAATAAPQGLASLPSSGGASSAESEEPKGPGIFERFKETKAYDKLQDELSTLGERFVEELSRTARTVVVPALLSKLKDLIGINLSTQQEVAQRSKLEQETARTAAGTAAADEKVGSSQSAAGQAAGSGGTAARAAAGTEGHGAS